jgi:hypothetical protein
VTTLWISIDIANWNKTMIEIMEHLIPDKVKRTNNEVKMSSKVFFYILIWREKEGSGHAASLDLRNRQYTEVP